jgi:protein-L-isoaspartate(D-aspartate) O-methyltransferase
VTLLKQRIMSVRGAGTLEDPKRRLFDSLREEIEDERVMRAMESVAREDFVPPEYRAFAYENVALPIEEGQTISQPYIVAAMLSALRLRATDRVLEVGTGSGYQAAVLSKLVRSVVTVERIPFLVEQASARLNSMGCSNVEVHLAGEELGWPSGAPYDAIIVAAASPRLPADLQEQLGEVGRMVVPVGDIDSQDLMVVTKTRHGVSVKSLGACRFVPLIGKSAWPPGSAEGKSSD